MGLQSEAKTSKITNRQQMLAGMWFIHCLIGLHTDPVITLTQESIGKKGQKAKNASTTCPVFPKNSMSY